MTYALAQDLCRSAGEESDRLCESGTGLERGGLSGKSQDCVNLTGLVKQPEHRQGRRQVDRVILSGLKLKRQRKHRPDGS
jgi:hypothetical protein